MNHTFLPHNFRYCMFFLLLESPKFDYLNLSHTFDIRRQIRLPSCNFKMEAMLWKVAHEGMKFNLWTTSHTLPLFYFRRLEFLISFKGTFEFDLNINVTFSCKLEFVCENWNFFFEIRAYLLLNIGVFGSFFFLIGIYCRKSEFY